MKNVLVVMAILSISAIAETKEDTAHSTGVSADKSSKEVASPTPEAQAKLQKYINACMPVQGPIIPTRR